LLCVRGHHVTSQQLRSSNAHFYIGFIPENIQGTVLHFAIGKKNASRFGPSWLAARSARLPLGA
jgi:hypothetical protein